MNRVNRPTIPIGVIPQHTIIVIVCLYNISQAIKYIKKYIKKDPLLHVDTLLADAKSWAGDADLSDWKVSPLYGEMKNLPQVLLFSGTRELLYPDIALLAEKLREANVKTEFKIGKN